MKVLAVVLMGLLFSQSLAAGDGTSLSPAFSLAAEQESMSRAERCLLELADASKRTRSLSYVFIGVGAAMTVGGIVVLAGIGDNGDFEGFFQALGAIVLSGGGVAVMAGGVGSLLMASGPERRYAAVKGLPSALEREQASRKALISLARSGRTKRYVSGGILSALAVYELAASSDARYVFLPGALAAFQFLRKSRAERAYARFMAGEGLPSEKINIGFGPGPHGGLRVVLTASF